MDTVIRLFYGLAVSTPTQLGYDPSIRRVPSLSGSNMSCYHIDVRHDDRTTKTFRTDRMISDFAADAMRGRGTRVWAVRDITDVKGSVTQADLDGRAVFALKDCWVNQDRPTEGENLDSVKEGLSKLDRGKAALVKHLLTKVSDGYVFVDGVADSTFACIRRGRALDSGWTKRIVTASMKEFKPMSMSSGGVHSIPDSFEAQVPSVYDHDRCHYRIVFEEVGTPLMELRTFGEIFRCLEGGVLGMSCIVSYC